MKKFITFIFAMVITLVSVNAFAQDRVNRPKIDFSSEAGPIINEVTGWGYNNSCGEWIESKNIATSTKNPELVNTEYYRSHEFSNIIDIQFKTIVYDNTLYYVLVWNKFDGYYLYPNIKKDWRINKAKHFMMFSSEDMDKLHNLTNTPITLELITARKGESSKFTDGDVIQTEMEKSKKYQYLSRTYFIIYKATDGSIRFNISNISKPSLIEKSYYEMSADQFNEFITVK